MSAPFLYYKELNPTSAVRHSIFFSPDGGQGSSEEYLFVAAQTAVNIYQVHRPDGSTSSSSSSPFLSLVYHSTLFGTVKDVQVYTPNMAHTHATNTRPQHLLLSLDSGKYCVARYDPQAAELHIMAMFNAQEGALGVGAVVKGSAHGQMLTPGVGNGPYVTCDDAHGIGCSALYGSQLFFFPLQEAEGMAGSTIGAAGGGSGEPTICSLRSPFLVDLYMRAELPGDIVDACFLPGASRPTLVTLREKDFLPIGHAKVRLHTYVVTAFTVDVVRKSVSVLWQHEELPHNSIRLLTLPGHRGSTCVLLVTMNALLLVSGEGVFGQAVNGFAASTVAPHIYLQTWPYQNGVELDGSHWATAGGHGEALVNLKDGRLINFRLLDATPGVLDIHTVKFEPKLLCQATRCGALAASPRGDAWFIGSSNAWSSLIHVRSAGNGKGDSRKVVSTILGGADIEIDAAGSVHAALPAGGSATTATTAVEKEPVAPPAKKIKREQVKKEHTPVDDNSERVRLVDMTAEVMESEEKNLYGSDLASLALLQAQDSLINIGNQEICVVDTVNVLGPVLGATFCRVDDSFDGGKAYLDWERMGKARGKALKESAASYITEREIKDGLQLNAGLDEQGSLVRISQGQRFTKIAARTMQGVSDIFAFQPINAKYTLLFLQGHKSRLLVQSSETLHSSTAKENGVAADAAEAVVQVNEVPLQASGFVSEPTLALAECVPGCIVQVTASSMRMITLDNTEASTYQYSSAGATAGTGACTGTVDIPGGILSADVLGGLVVAVDKAGAIHAVAIEAGAAAMATTTATKGKSTTKAQLASAAAAAAATDTPGAAVTYTSRTLDGTALKALLPANCVPIGITLYSGIFPSCEPITATGSKNSVSKEGSLHQSAAQQSTATPRKGSAGGAPHTQGSLKPGTPHGGTSNAHNSKAAVGSAREKMEEEYLYGSVLSTAAAPAPAPAPAATEEAAEADANATAGRKRTRAASIAESVAESVAESDAGSVAGSISGISKGSKAKKVAKPKAPKKLTKKQQAALDAIAEEAQAEAEVPVKGLSLQAPTETKSVPHASETVTVSISCAPARHAVVWCSAGEVAVIDMDAEKLVFYTAEMGLMPQSLSVQRVLNMDPASREGKSQTADMEVEGARDQNSNTVASNQAAFRSATLFASNFSSTSSHNRKIHAVRIASLSGLQDPAQLQRLCITVLLGTGDLVCYVLGGSNDGQVKMQGQPHVSNSMRTGALFTKMSHTCVTRRRRLHTAPAGATPGSSSKVQYESGINYRLQYLPDINGKNAIAVTGSNPVLVQAEQGSVQALPLCFPEVQYANAGTMLVCPLVAGEVAGLVTLWQEPERHSRHTMTRTPAHAILGMYQTSPGTFSLPGSDLSFRRIIVSKTIKTSVEFTERGDDKTEQELLQRRTFLLGCSEEVFLPFVKNVISEEVRLEQLKLYDRYFQDLSSWCQPDINIGAPALRSIRRDELVLMQGGEPISSYRLPEGEVLLAADVVCLATEKVGMQLNIGMGRPPAHGVGGKKRVFVVCSTLKPDTHGEDTPGEGRLLLFSLDYSVFQPAGQASSAGLIEELPDAGDAAAVIKTETSEETNGDSSEAPVPPPPPAVPADGFGAMIQPKLRLEWTGPGASSVVQGFGEFILATVDSMLYVYKMLPGTMELEQVAFWKANVYIKNVSIIKDRFFAVVDFLHSVQFLVWNQTDYSITLLGKDFGNTVGLTSSFIRDGPNLGILLGDVEANIQLMQYAPKNPDSREGSRLLTTCDFHVGADPNVMISHPSVIGGGGSINQQLGVGVRCSKGSNKDVIVVGTAAGSVGMLVTLEEKVYRRLALLQQLMVTVVPTTFGLNPKEYRQMKHRGFKAETKHGVLDGVLLALYICMDAPLQDELSAAMGIDTPLLLETLRDINAAGAVF